MTAAIADFEKKQDAVATDGLSAQARAERFALQIERAVHDTHATSKEYAAHIRTLNFNLKKNAELCGRLLHGTLTPAILAVMTSDDLASEEMRRQTAEMKAKAEKQSILTTEEGPRVRRTHKGEEMVEGDNFAMPTENKPSAIRRQSVREGQEPKPQEPEHPADVELPAQLELRQSPAPRDETQPSPKNDFDINKVFSSVRSPVTAQPRQPSQPAPLAEGPGVDPEVDRLLQDDHEESPPYSPSEETDPDVVWRGPLTMNSVADFPAVAKHIGGVNLNTTIHLPWTTLIPKKLTVAVRIDEQKATEYLCGLRYRAPTDITVVSLSPATEAARPDFLALVDYFITKKRYGVVGDKGVGNVRDTYLIPVPPGTNNHPEFMLNLEDNFIPPSRTEPMLLVVFVYRNDAAAMEQLHGPNWAGQQGTQSPAASTPTPVPGGPPQRAASLSAPAFSPTSPQGGFPGRPAPLGSTEPPAPRTPQQPAPAYAAIAPAPPPAPASVPGGPPQQVAESVPLEGEALARHILGPLMSSQTVNFILPQAHQMKPQEWMLIRDIYLRDPRTQNDLQCLSVAIESASQKKPAPSAPPPSLPPAPAPRTSQTPVPVPQVPHSLPPSIRQPQGHPPPTVPQPAAAPPA